MRDAERRHVCRLIDLAVERCEDANLREQLAVPRWIADLVVHLQAAAGEAALVPRHTIAPTAYCSTYAAITCPGPRRWRPRTQSWSGGSAAAATSP
jgi:hypothetical protein